MKTLEKAAREYANEFMQGLKESGREDIEGYSARAREVIWNAANAGFIKGVRAAQRWIPVGEQLPETAGEYFVECRNGKRIQYDVDWFENGKFFHRKNVLRWRHLELPVEEW
ncbi:MAG: hypothetical protein MdMp024_0941 [Bacteroidales bacterium]